MLAKKPRTRAARKKPDPDASKNAHKDLQNNEQQDILTENRVQRLCQFSRQPQKAAFAGLILDTVFDAIEQYPIDKLPEQLGSGTQMLVKLLEETEAERIMPADNDPLEGARLRGIAARERLLKAEGGPLTVSQVEKMLQY